jgi:hypothetical protein
VPSPIPDSFRIPRNSRAPVFVITKVYLPWASVLLTPIPYHGDVAEFRPCSDIWCCPRLAVSGTRVQSPAAGFFSLLSAIEPVIVTFAP